MAGETRQCINMSNYGFPVRQLATQLTIFGIEQISVHRETNQSTSPNKHLT